MNVLMTYDANLDSSGVCRFIRNWIYTLRTDFPEKIDRITLYFRKGITNEELYQELLSFQINIVTGNREGTTWSKTNRQGVHEDLETILQDHYDILHIHSSAFGFSALILSIVGKRIKTKILHTHGQDMEKWYSVPYKAVLRHYINHQDIKRAACSKEAAEYFFHKDAIMIPNVIDTKKFEYNKENRRKYRKELGISFEILAGAVGSLTVRKNHAFLLNVIEKTSASLVILGEGPERENLERKIKEKGLENRVFLIGNVSNVHEWLSAMDVFLMPSLHEGFGISAVEAQANDLFCIMSNTSSPESNMGLAKYIPLNTYSWIREIEHATRHHNGVYFVQQHGYDISSNPIYVKKLYEI